MLTCELAFSQVVPTDGEVEPKLVAIVNWY
jgi:hypothetical protein